MASVKILTVDDEVSITNLVSAYLKPEGYEVYTATDGASGLQANGKRFSRVAYHGEISARRSPVRHVKDRVLNFPPAMFARVSGGLILDKVWCNHLPLGIIQSVE